jgi:hypothetical protein
MEEDCWCRCIIIIIAFRCGYIFYLRQYMLVVLLAVEETVHGAEGLSPLQYMYQKVTLTYCDSL